MRCQWHVVAAPYRWPQCAACSCARSSAPMAASPVTLVSTAAATAARRWLPATPELLPPAALPGAPLNSACSCCTVCCAKRRRAARGSAGTCHRSQLQRAREWWG